jgi:PmbA protein
VLIDDGILREFLSDRQAAARDGMPSNGSGWRGPAGEAPATRARFLELDGANGLAWQAFHPRDCIPGTLWVRQAHGMHMANDITGNFSFAASGVVADGSSMGRPVRGFTVTGNAHEMLQHIEGVSRCSHLIKSPSGFLRSPHARISGLTIVT